MSRNELHRIVKIESISAAHELRLPGHSSHALFVVAGGMGTLRINGSKHSLALGKGFYVMPGIAVSWTPYFNQLSLYRVTFDRLKLAEALDNKMTFERDNARFVEREELQDPYPNYMLDMALALWDSEQSDDAHARDRTQMLFHELIYHLAIANTPVNGAGTREAVDRTITYIHEHFAEDLSRDRLASMAKLSPEYYSALFKQLSGRSLTDYITDYRLRMAKERLLFTSERLKDIAKMVGYKDEYYFSRKFKKEVGISPSDYVKANKKIVSLNPHITRQLLALDVIPAATLAFRWMFGEHQQRLEEQGCECRDWTVGFTEEELRALQPDLIMCIDNCSAEIMNRYKSIAPTLVVPWHAADWREHLKMIARAINKQDAARRWLDRFAASVERIRLLMKQSGITEQTLTLFNIRAEHSFVYRNHGMGSQIVYEELGFRRPEPLQPDSEQVLAAVSPAELLPRYSAERIILSIEKDDRAEKRAMEMLESEPWREWLSKRGHKLHFVDMERWHGYDAISAGWQLDDAERLLFLP
jgi:AraC-like DNA-binding protein